MNETLSCEDSKFDRLDFRAAQSGLEARGTFPATIQLRDCSVPEMVRLRVSAGEYQSLELTG